MEEERERLGEVVVTVRVPRDVADALDKQARRELGTRSAVARRLLAASLGLLDTRTGARPTTAR